MTTHHEHGDWSSEEIDDEYDYGEDDYEDDEAYYYTSGWTRGRVMLLLIVMIIVAALLVFVVFPALNQPQVLPELPPLQPPVQV